MTCAGATTASRALVVEDEMLVRMMIADVLADHGFQVEAFSSAKDALRHLASGAPCDVLFTDINLPGGIDGTELAGLARKLRAGLPVVYTSGAAKRAEVEAVPNSFFIAKPYDPESVCKVLRAFAAIYARDHAPPADQLSARNSSSQWM